MMYKVLYIPGGAGFSSINSIMCSREVKKDQTEWLVVWMIHGARIPDPTNGQSLVFGIPGCGVCSMFNIYIYVYIYIYV